MRSWMSALCLALGILAGCGGNNSTGPKKDDVWDYAGDSIMQYTRNDKLFLVSKKEFNVLDQFSAATLRDQSQECGTNQTEQYFQNLLQQYVDRKGVQYSFQYQGESQGSGIWTVTVIPNRGAYRTDLGFKSDFDMCFAGGDKYPSLMTDSYLLFISSCGSGFDDGSGRPIGCDEVQEVVWPTIKLYPNFQRREEPFVFTGKRTSGSNADLYKGYVIVEGRYERYRSTNGAPLSDKLTFFVDEEYRRKLPIKYGERSSVFIFDNKSEANEALQTNSTFFLDESICQISGRAKISIEDYTVELLESEVYDHTRFVRVLSTTDRKIETCSDLGTGLWKTYADDIYAFTFKYPESWKVGIGYKANILYLIPVGGQDVSMSMFVFYESLEESEKFMPVFDVAGRNVNSRINVTINGINWVKLVVDGNQIVQLTYHDKKTYAFQYSIFEDISPQILSTFKFTK